MLPQQAQKIQENYANVKNAGTGSERLASRILPIRDFNNWAKAALLHLAAALQPKNREMAVLDLCCGKGGDLAKFSRLGQVSYYTGVDITLESLVEAIRRYNSLISEAGRQGGFQAKQMQADFVLADVCAVPLAKHILDTKFDVISCMFAMHYAFQSRQAASVFFANVKQLLQPGGCFVAVFPNKDVIAKRLANSGGLSFGNQMYSVAFQSQQVAGALKSNLFGQAYDFDLAEAVQTTTEFLIDLRDLKDVCQANQLVIKTEFPNLETLLQAEAIPAKAKQLFPQMMRKTAKFVHLMNQNLKKGASLQDENFWDNLDDEKVDQVQADQVQKITDLSQIDEQFLEVIRLYSAVLVVHVNPLEVAQESHVQLGLPEPRRLADVCNLSGAPIDVEKLRAKYADAVWEPAVFQ